MLKRSRVVNRGMHGEYWVVGHMNRAGRGALFSPSVPRYTRTDIHMGNKIRGKEHEKRCCCICSNRDRLNILGQCIREAILCIFGEESVLFNFASLKAKQKFKNRSKKTFMKTIRNLK